MARGPPAEDLSASVWTIDLTDPSDHQISLGVVGTDLVLTVNGITATRALQLVSSVLITGAADHDDTLTLLGPIPVPVTFDGGDGGFDTIVGSHDHTAWNVTGAGAGSVGNVTFTNVEHLAGAPDNEDTFAFESGGSLTGGVDGGPGGFDTLVVDAGAAAEIRSFAVDGSSGTIVAGNRTIVYAGLEPVLVNAGNATNTVFTLTAGADEAVLEAVSATQLRLRSTATTPTFEATTFTMPTTSLTINLGAGADNITIASLGTYTGQLIVVGGDGEDTLGGPAAGAAWVIESAGAGTLGSAEFSEFEVLAGGSGVDTLTGPDVDTAWEIAGADAGALDGFAFSGFEQLVGGSAVDAFAIVEGGSISGSIAGGGGSDALVAWDTANDWELTAQNAGTLEFGSAPTVTIAFASIENLIGGAGDDTFVIGASAGVDGLVDGGPADADADPQPVDTLDYSAWTAAVEVHLTGGDTSLELVFSSATANADPGAGTLRLGSATQNAATVIRVDLDDATGTAIAALLDAFDDGPGTIKGRIRLVERRRPDEGAGLRRHRRRHARRGRIPQHHGRPRRVERPVAVRRRRRARPDLRPRVADGERRRCVRRHRRDRRRRVAAGHGDRALRSVPALERHGRGCLRRRRDLVQRGRAPRRRRRQQRRLHRRRRRRASADRWPAARAARTASSSIRTPPPGRTSTRPAADSAGTASLHGKTIVYSGLDRQQVLTGCTGANIVNCLVSGTFSDDTIVVEAGATAGTTTVRFEGTGWYDATTGLTTNEYTFANPTESLTIEAREGTDSITVQSLGGGFGAGLNLYGHFRATSGPPMPVDDPYLDTVTFAGSIDTGGHTLDVWADNIVVANDVSLTIGDGYINLRARLVGIATLENLLPGFGTDRRVSIEIGERAVLSGTGIYLIAQAEDKSLSDTLGLEKEWDNFVIDTADESRRGPDGAAREGAGEDLDRHHHGQDGGAAAQHGHRGHLRDRRGRRQRRGGGQPLQHRLRTGEGDGHDRHRDRRRDRGRSRGRPHVDRERDGEPQRDDEPRDREHPEPGPAGRAVARRRQRRGDLAT